MGTGDGRLPYTWAREAPGRLFVGLDAHAAGMREFSRRACRARLPNAVFVRASVEDWPAELEGLADRVTVVLPWGSLLAALARPLTPALRKLRGACQAGATLTVVLGSDVARDRAELWRLGLPPLVADGLAERIGAGYAEAGFAIARVGSLAASELRRWPTTWARRLAHGGSRSFVEIQGRAL